MGQRYDAVVVGSGPNGLAAAVAVARAGGSVLVREAGPTIGGATRTEALTEAGFVHDVGSAIHPTGVLSPFFRSLPLGDHGLKWCAGALSAAHPLDDRPAAVLSTSMDAVADRLGQDALPWRRLFSPFLGREGPLFADLLAPLRLPRHPLLLARFGLRGLRSARGLAEGRFEAEAARALLAGCAAHSVLPLEFLGTAAVGMVFAIAGHAVSWPCAKGGSRAITDALAALLEAHGGVIERDRPVDDLADLPDHGVAIFDTSPRALARVAGDALPAGYRDRLERFRYGPGVFKIDYALSGSIPWTDPVCAGASTVHVGGTFDEIAASERAAWRGEVCDRPFVMVCQQSAMDDSRAPPGQHTGYAYCHVPAGCDVDMTAAIEAQLERFAPGFSDLILARHTLAPKDLEGRNRNCIGGAITGGAADLRQLFTRPVARLRPHTTPNPRIFLCSASTPPGGGVHGMGGYWAARAACRQLGLPMPPLSPEG